MLKILIDSRNLVFERSYVLISLVAVEFQYTPHLYIEKTDDVVALHLADKRRLERLQTLVDMSHRLVYIAALLVLLILIYPLLYEYPFQRSEHQTFQQFAALYLQLTAKQILSVVDTTAQHIAYSQKMRLTVGNHATIRRYADFAIRESIQSINGTVARRSGNQMHDYIGMLCRIVIHPADFYLSFFLSLYDRIDKRASSLAVWYVGYLKRLVVYLVNLGAHPHRAATPAIVVFRHINIAACRKIGIQ